MRAKNKYADQLDQLDFAPEEICIGKLIGNEVF
jgi:hypothetical protein